MELPNSKMWTLTHMISRKIITASVSGSLFAVLLGLINPFGGTITSFKHYLLTFVLATPVYLMYSFPFIIVYGVLASIISDKLSRWISAKLGAEKFEIMISAVLHLVFGLILRWYSLGASLLFFITDRLLKKNNREYKLKQAMKSLAIPFAVWLIFIGMVWIEHIL
ncbi:hypothetical protein [Thermobacillus sp. ZCTH02-B1]|uniref:hypothetical protein n=1 Tax=Thermobacillus sp. ZCTH02-B1 TaxID=1858795 RepID=UPI0025EFCBEF|nr:hypothetical protein [Thermobacillus sp. ZCTH02-B1]